jgi:hypothetical protein
MLKEEWKKQAMHHAFLGIIHQLTQASLFVIHGKPSVSSSSCLMRFLMMPAQNVCLIAVKQFMNQLLTLLKLEDVTQVILE